MYRRQFNTPDNQTLLQYPEHQKCSRKQRDSESQVLADTQRTWFGSFFIHTFTNLKFIILFRRDALLQEGLDVPSSPSSYRRKMTTRSWDLDCLFKIYFTFLFNVQIYLISTLKFTLKSKDLSNTSCLHLPSEKSK